jgi:hypothetical protein
MRHGEEQPVKTETVRPELLGALSVGGSLRSGATARKGFGLLPNPTEHRRTATVDLEANPPVDLDGFSDRMILTRFERLAGTSNQQLDARGARMARS